MNPIEKALEESIFHCSACGGSGEVKRWNGQFLPDECPQCMNWIKALTSLRSGEYVVVN